MKLIPRRKLMPVTAEYSTNTSISNITNITDGGGEVTPPTDLSAIFAMINNLSSMVAYLLDLINNIKKQKLNIATSTDLITAGTRVFNQVYQNNNPNPMMVEVFGYMRIAITTGTTLNGSSKMEAHVQATVASPLATPIIDTGFQCTLTGLVSGANSVIQNGSLSFLVPPYYYYEILTSITGSGETPVEQTWWEYILSVKDV